MKYLIPILLLLSCKKDTNTITFKMAYGAGDVVVTQGNLITDFQACPEGWHYTVEAQPQTRYTIRTTARHKREVQVIYNGAVKDADSIFAVYTTP